MGKDAPSPKSKRTLAVRAVVVLLVVAGLVIAGRWLLWRIGHVTTNAAYVKADMANIAPEVPGKIVAIPVREGERVSAGQVLLRIDPEQLDRHVALAEADLSAVQSRKARYEEDLHQARLTVPAMVNAARAALDMARRQQAKARANNDHWQAQYRRFKQLYDRQVIGKARFDEVETAWRAAEADLAAAAAQTDLAASRLREAEATRSLIPKAEAANREVADGISKAREARKLALLNRSRCDVKAPFNGIVARVLLREGDYAAPGRPAIAIYSPDTRYLEARFEESSAAEINASRYLRPRARRPAGRANNMKSGGEPVFHARFCYYV
jgi:membrane fusion protein (multidrug efflux system)